MFFLLSAVAASTSFDANDALRLCRPVLASKAGGDIQAISTTSVRKDGRGFTLKGKLTAFIGMGPPAAGSASTHHLIRANFDFRCSTVGRNVGKATILPRQ